MRIVPAVFAPLFVLGLCTLSQAAHATVEAVADRASVEPGGRVTVAFSFTVQPEWHVYWMNPGDTGLPPRIKWTGPKGTVYGTPQFPVPKRIDAGGVTAFGYEKEMTLLVDVTVPTDATESVVLRADLKWLACADACVAEAQSVTITLPVGVAKPNADPRFEGWRAAQPTRIPPLSIAATIAPDAKWGSLDVPLPAGTHGVEFFPPKTDFAEFGQPVARGNVYQLPFRILPGAPGDYQAVGLVVTRDDKIGKTASREINFSYKIATP